MFLKGGPVMWPIFLCSIFALAIIMERIWYLRKIRIDTRQLLDKILDKMRRHQIKEALEVCEITKNPLSQILKAGILKYDRGRPEIKEAIKDAALYEEPQLERNMTTLATIAHISPLLGLLGTVLGMVRSFQIIQAKSTALQAVSPGDLAGGIWEALLTTVAGLIVAIPAFVAYNYLVSRISNFLLEMETASTELVNFLAEQ
ncbi:MAG: MotA/TolQ/ExbB proton channel family protein [Candidatus Omnitrophota bacterium]